MATRLYLANQNAAYTPPTIRGNWADKTLIAASRLAPVQVGTVATAARAETSTVNGYRVLLRRFVSDPLNNGGTFAGQLNGVYSVIESNAAMNAYLGLYIYVTVGSTDVVRGVLLNNHTATTEWGLAGDQGVFFADGSTIAIQGLALTTVAGVLPGDRVVMEWGYAANNAVATSYTGTMRYGGQGTDASAGEILTPRTRWPTWVEFVGAGPDALFGPPIRGDYAIPVVTAPVLTTAYQNTGKRIAVESTLATDPRHQFNGQRRFTVYSNVNPSVSVTASRFTAVEIEQPTDVRRASAASSIRLLTTKAMSPSIALPTFVTIEGSQGLPPPDVEIVEAPYVQPKRQGLRFIAQNIRNGRFIDWDLPLLNAEITFTLSGPSIIRGTLAPEATYIPGLEAWATYIHAEEDGQIRASGILQPGSIGEGESLSIEAIGLASYPADVIYGASLSEIQIDPLDVVRRIWANILSYPDSPTNVLIAPTKSPMRIGEPEKQALDENGNPAFDEESTTTADGGPITLPVGDYIDRTDGKRYRVKIVNEETGEKGLFYLKPRIEEAKPYQLFWWNTPNCLDTINQLATATPFDYVERPRWNATRTNVEHYIDLGYPRLGALRNDLRFAQDENLTEVVPLAETPDFWASGVIQKGAGEGRRGIYGYAAGQSRNRVRRLVTVTDKRITDAKIAKAAADEELRRRQNILTIGNVVALEGHSNAPIGSYAEGDDVIILAELPWHGALALKHRIISYTWRPDAQEVDIQLRRSEQFAYGRREVDIALGSVD